MSDLNRRRLEAAAAVVVEQGRKRALNMGADFNEADYLAGAMVVLSLMQGFEGEEVKAFDELKVATPEWVFAIMRGDSVVNPGQRRPDGPTRGELLKFVKLVASARVAVDLDRRMLWEEARELLSLDEDEEGGQ